MAQSKEPIRLRKRKTPTGLYSIYLDIYLNGQKSYEYLKLYLIPETSRTDKHKNQETMKLAEAIRGKRLVELQNSEYGFNPLSRRTAISTSIMWRCAKSVSKTTRWGIGGIGTPA
ncbi:Arm DNA-binding domain-containing protein [Marseilla massiliensis]|uniref:Arm DNA-binding domain-containing protein n=1 Tax=Marseilla massiliensis TaxID=1841864 RepID=UPI001EF4D223|nr:Arm DNA-binding domain-containing protein [Marseilla massiliensis]